MTLTTYTIDRLTKREEFVGDVWDFMLDMAPKMSGKFGDKFNYENFQIFKVAALGHFYICRRDEEITGLLIATLFPSFFDPEIKILYQQTLYVKPDSGRTAYHLFKKFIDIGKREANHIITMLTSQTNIKPDTLNRLGFKELETLYRMEV